MQTILSHSLQYLIKVLDFERKVVKGFDYLDLQSNSPETSGI